MASSAGVLQRFLSTRWVAIGEGLLAGAWPLHVVRDDTLGWLRAKIGSAAQGVRVGSVLAALLVATGCETSCGEPDQRPIPYADGQLEISGERAVYVTSPLDGTWLHFPSQRRFRLEHGLGTKDVVVAALLAFSEHPVDSGTGYAEAAGDTVLVEKIDENSIQVRNDTCAEFFLHVRVESLAPAADSSD